MLRCVGPLLLFAMIATAAEADDWYALGQIPPNQTVTVEMRDGRQLKGKILEVVADGLVLETPAADLTPKKQVRLDRAGIARIKKKVRLLTSLIGAGVVGTAGGIGMAVDTSPKDTSTVKTYAVLLSIGIGAGIGAAIGRNMTIYEAGAPR